ncbi:MAG: response regulator [Magnetococcus sp. WYHC-3]
MSRILVVEDNQINQQVTLGLLRNLGYSDVDLAEDGLSALGRATREHYDLILMDVRMPGLDGLEVVRRIRGWESRQQSPRVPIIALTAHAMVQDREQCLAAGMDDYLAKPVRKAMLGDMVAQWLRRGTQTPAHA